MQTTNIFYKSDFKILLDSDTGWAVPFRLRFFTSTQARPFTATFDGSTYTNCHLQADGRLCIAFDAHGLGLGQLMLQPTFYLSDQCFRDNICDEAIPPFPVTCHIPDDDTDTTITLSLHGASTLTTIGTLPAYYQVGPAGPQGPQGAPGRDGQDGLPGGLLFPRFDADAAAGTLTISEDNDHIQVDTSTGNLVILD